MKRRHRSDLRFTKMHGLGNDFMVIDAITQNVQLNPQQIRKWSDRHFGIGFDQLLVVEPPHLPDVDFTYRIFNADGGEVEQCGNGARCFAKFIRDKRLTTQKTVRVQTSSGIIELTVTDQNEVVVNMGVPHLDPDKIPFQADERSTHYSIDADNQQFEVGAVSMGNPHVILRVENVDTAPVSTLGPVLECHPRFPKRVNVGFMQIMNREHIRLRVFERGVGETLACGTGACGAVVSGIVRGWLNNTVKVDLPGGRLTIQWAGESSPVMMTGPATTVYEGFIRDNQ